MLTTASVPAPFLPPFEAAEVWVKKLFSNVSMRPEQGTIHVGGDRYVLVRAESFYLALYDALAQSFGEETARQFIYNTAREIGASDSRAFAQRLGVENPVEKLASGPVHFAHAGWAFVNILEDSAPATNDSYFLHYTHPNTFESEVLKQRAQKAAEPACHFSSGYSAGWCSNAFGLEVHAREVRCLAHGDDRCEFIMAPASKLDAHAAAVLGR